MSTNKNASEEGIELQSQPKPAAVQAPVADQEGHNNLIEIDETVDADKAGNAPDGVSPLTTPAEAKEASVAAPVAGKKKFKFGLFSGLFSGFNREKRDAVIKGVMIAAVCVLGAATIGLGVKVGMDVHTIENLQSSVNYTTTMAPVQRMAAFATGLEIRGTYLEGMPGVLDGGFNLELAEHAISSASVTSGACDDVVETFPVATAMANSTATMTTTLLNTAAPYMVSFVTVNGGMRTLSAIDLTGVPTQPVPVMATVLTSSVSMAETTMSTSMSNASSFGTPSSSSTSFPSHTCSEWGDGAGPCTRPYGRPNSTPASVVSSESAFGGLKTATYTPPVMESLSSVARTSSIPSATALAGPMSATNDCGPTATVFVTVTAANDMTSSRAGSTVYGTSTELSFVTLTISGVDGGPLTTTETVFWSSKNATTTATQVAASINGTLTTLSLANFTVTMPHTAPNPTVTTTAVVQSPTSSSAAVASGAEQSTPKPLTASSSGGSGVYCAVMLLTLLVLLL